MDNETYTYVEMAFIWGFAIFMGIVSNIKKNQ
jgi:hypothetical protein